MLLPHCPSRTRGTSAYPGQLGHEGIRAVEENGEISARWKMFVEDWESFVVLMGGGIVKQLCKRVSMDNQGKLSGWYRLSLYYSFS